MTTPDYPVSAMGLRVSMVFLERSPTWESTKPYNLQYYPQEDFPMHNHKHSEELVLVRNIQDRDHPPTLDREGFELRQLKTDMTYEDFKSEEKIQEVYCTELEEHFADVLGANHVRTLDFQLRRRKAGWPDEGPRALLPSSPQPSKMTHIDSTLAAATKIVKELYGARADSILRSRYMIITVWRALRVPIVDWPLAVCDATTIDPVDKVASDVIYPNYLAENRLIHYHENQAWYWVPHYTQDDILVFKATDSEDENAGTPHGAFPLPDNDRHVSGRESIDVRLLVMYGDI